MILRLAFFCDKTGSSKAEILLDQIPDLEIEKRRLQLSLWKEPTLNDNGSCPYNFTIKWNWKKGRRKLFPLILKTFLLLFAKLAVPLIFSVRTSY